MTRGRWAWRRVLLATAGALGAIGVMAAAAASHGDGSRNLGAIAAIGLAHGPALLALALAGRGRVLGVAAALMAVGTAIFAGDLAMREWLGAGLFPGAAPLGGVGMTAGWLAIVAAALAWRQRRLLALAHALTIVGALVGLAWSDLDARLMLALFLAWQGLHFLLHARFWHYILRDLRRWLLGRP